MKYCYLSFADSDRPAGSQWLGSCIVPGTFPACVSVAWAMGCNPGGEVLSSDIPESMEIPEYVVGRLYKTREAVQGLFDRLGWGKAQTIEEYEAAVHGGKRRRRRHDP